MFRIIIAIVLFLFLFAIDRVLSHSHNEEEKNSEFSDITKELAKSHKFQNLIRERDNGSFSIEMPTKRITCVKRHDVFYITLINGEKLVPVNNVEVSRKKDLINLLETLTN